MVLRMLLDETELFYVHFLTLIYGLMLVLELLCEHHSYLFFVIYITKSLLHLLIFILSDKNGKSLCKLCKPLRYSTSTSKIYPLLLSPS